MNKFKAKLLKLKNSKRAAANPIFVLVSVVVGLIVLAIFGGMSIVGAQNSANLASGTSLISQALPLIGVGIFVSLIGIAMKAGGKL